MNASNFWDDGISNKIKMIVDEKKYHFASEIDIKMIFKILKSNLKQIS